MDAVGGEGWHNGVAVWKVVYEYADANGGGGAVDYFKTANRRTPPTGAGVEDCVNSDEMTLLGIEGIEFYWIDGLDEGDTERPPSCTTRHGRVFDLTRDMRGAVGRLEVRE